MGQLGPKDQISPELSTSVFYLCLFLKREGNTALNCRPESLAGWRTKFPTGLRSYSVGSTSRGEVTPLVLIL